MQAAPEDDSAAEPQLFGDWREFRAKLILGEQQMHMHSMAFMHYCAVEALQRHPGLAAAPLEDAWVVDRLTHGS